MGFFLAIIVSSITLIDYQKSYHFLLPATLGACLRVNHAKELWVKGIGLEIPQSMVLGIEVSVTPDDPQLSMSKVLLSSSVEPLESYFSSIIPPSFCVIKLAGLTNAMRVSPPLPWTTTPTLEWYLISCRTWSQETILHGSKSAISFLVGRHLSEPAPANIKLYGQSRRGNEKRLTWPCG